MKLSKRIGKLKAEVEMLEELYERRLATKDCPECGGSMQFVNVTPMDERMDDETRYCDKCNRYIQISVPK